MSADAMKRAAAAAALDFVEPGMRLGLGTGSTAAWFVRLLAEKVTAGLDVVGVPTSEATATLAREVGVPLTSLDAVAGLDLTVDGADEFDPDFNLIKGGGGALLREKIVAADSRRMVVITDESKAVARLGAFPLPIEVTSFGAVATLRAIAEAARRTGHAGALTFRAAPGGGRFTTDQGNAIVDASFRQISDPQALADALVRIPGVVEHGLFIGYASTVIVAGRDGIRRLDKPAN
ncbi:ribose-5-phosphate isomerase RpiA [Oharaeibacter diazotrophicus]|uniref:Ribose-5-phosphate isomerase A n=1 Tax=Oharaeibacter diazotrophicus TaxID=1920512 RepID=A0A4R6RJG1_9HYPH|nr:ribose-5-phosphate isomerase RpiA [Oharaeibacter diazotrophicus]TDP86245.1 ribose-5-phosphate isomerase [Oharaeibacter diazotrophicus]BBE71814.1 ribose-5-phosphate isomerase A [Pleomorphomonas sp. SM30]GLS78579.1 ribose-5-phosphate isomerase A [Oharaeibacter diazotrophicus]